MTKQLHCQTSEFLASVAQSMPALSGRDMQHWVENPAKLGLALERALARKDSAKQKRLRWASKHSLPERKKAFDPNEFFKTCKELHVWDDVRSRVESVGIIESIPAIKFASFNLVMDANDRKIMDELPRNCVFEEREFWSHLAGMIKRQRDGKEGLLLNNVCENIFFVRDRTGEVFTVIVYWYSCRPGWWYVNAYELDVKLWGTGGRVFSRNCPSAP